LSRKADYQICTFKNLNIEMTKSILIFSLSVALTAPQTLNAQIPVVDGWSQFTASADSRLIYVSDLTGNDAIAQHYLPSSPQVGADPFQPSGTILPYKTLDAAKALLRPGFPDWILFKRGETWAGQGFGAMALYGRSASEPMLIGAYGTCASRPTILTGTGTFIDFLGSSASNFAITGIHARPHTYTGTGGPVAVRLIEAPFSNFLIEDCFFEYFSTHIAAHSLPSYSTSHQNLKVRRCILSNAYSTSGSNGLFIANVDGILIEENLIDHNGWNESVSGAEASGFSHNTYFQVSNANLIFQNNVVSRASATGGGFRCGGTVLNNLFLSNPKGIQFGTAESLNGTGGGLDWPTQFVSGEVANNVLLDARVESFEAGTGIQVQRAKFANVHHNIMAHFTPVSTYNVGILLNEAEGIDLHNNIVYNWANNHTSGNDYASALTCGAGLIGSNSIHDNDFQMNNTRGSCVGQNVAFAQTIYQNNRYYNVMTGGTWYEQWFQPQGSYGSWVAASGETGSSNSVVTYSNAAANISTYLSSIGQSGGLQAFIDACKLNSRCAWDNDFSANSVNDYIRSSFDAPVAMPVELLVLDARYVGEESKLHWKTAVADQVLLFEVQRSENGLSWQTLGEVPVKTPQTALNTYFFTDHTPLEEAYYRLCVLENDGSRSYSDMVALSVRDIPNMLLFPNPATDKLQIKVENFEPQRLQIIDINQTLLMDLEIQGSAQIPVQHLMPGLYFVRAIAGWQALSGRFLKK
jgi:Secretion system C-terminal sorting domain